MLDKVKTLRTVYRHCKNVQKSLRKVIGNLVERSEVHDLSKFSDIEFEGVVQYQQLDGLAYGSEEYDAKMDEIRPYTEDSWNSHVRENSHHPEYHEKVADMSFLDIIEMVCDWKGANETYNTSGQSFREGSLLCVNRYDFTDGQIWLIHQLIDFLE